jgi:hypothetical protein
VRSYFAIKCSESLLMKMKFGALPSMTIHDASTFSDYVKFLEGRGDAMLRATGYVNVEVHRDVSNKKADGVVRAAGRESAQRKDASAFSELKLMLADGSKGTKDGIRPWGIEHSCFLVRRRQQRAALAVLRSRLRCVLCEMWLTPLDPPWTLAGAPQDARLLAR